MANPTPFSLYDASAGSGKTFTLVKNYLSILLLSPDISAYKNILAITFTNKAVAEMKERIVESLKAFATHPIPSQHLALFEAIQEKTEMELGQIQAKSAKILKHILHNYAAFEVSTIDSFTHRILRSFAKDLNIPVNFEVQLETDEILQEAVDRVIGKAGKDPLLTQTLIDFALSKADDDKSWDIAYDLNKIAKLLTNENNLDALAALKGSQIKDFAKLGQHLRTQIKVLEKNCKELAQDFQQIMSDRQLDNSDFTRKYIPNYFEKILQDNFPYPTQANWQNEIETAALYPKRLAESKKEVIDSLQPNIAALYRMTERMIIRMDFLKSILSKNTSLSLLTAIDEEVSQIKEERNLLLISEFNKKISDSIKNEPAPFIYERLGDRYKTYFIDEFQDTSVLQWENLIPLVGDSLASANGSVSLVGDAKQSIYRWRGGKAEQFMELNADKNPFHVEKKYERLPNNYRSLPEIVEFNNGFFKHISQFIQHEPYRLLFEKTPQHPIKKEGGYVNLQFISAKNKEEKNEVYPEEVYRIIENLIQSGHTYKEICILVRKKEQGVILADYLNAQQVPLISSETLLLKKSPAVNFLIGIVKLGLQPNDQNARFEALHFLHKHLNLEISSFNFIQPRLALEPQTFFESLKSYEIHFDLNHFLRLPIYDAVEYSIRSFDLVRIADAYLQFFLDFVYDYSEKHTEGLQGLIDLWNLKNEKLSISIPEGGNAVQIMTIHKSKGLEFPIVIYPYANEKLDDTSLDQVWIELSEEESPNIPVAYVNANKKMLDYNEHTTAVYSELLEHNELDALNVFYVAMTRPKNQLYILSEMDVDKNGQEKLNTFSGLAINYLKTIGLWDEEESVYSFGNPPVAEIQVSEQPEEENYFIATAPESHAIELVTLSGQLWGSPQEGALEEGNLLHYLLQQLVYAEDLDQLMEKAVLNGTIAEAQQTEYRQKMLDILSHPELAEYYTEAYEVFNEKEILFDGSYKRLDRLCLQGKKAIIIDYKTGEQHSSHIRQINTYAKALDALGYEIAEKLLVYLQDTVHVNNVE